MPGSAMASSSRSRRVVARLARWSPSSSFGEVMIMSGQAFGKVRHTRQRAYHAQGWRDRAIGVSIRRSSRRIAESVDLPGSAALDGSVGERDGGEILDDGDGGIGQAGD